MQPVIIVCETCGSSDVRRDSFVSWDLAAQEWVAAEILDDGYCCTCEARRHLVERPASYENRVQALEAQGLTRSDAQGVVDAEDLQR